MNSCSYYLKSNIFDREFQDGRVSNATLAVNSCKFIDFINDNQTV